MLKEKLPLSECCNEEVADNVCTLCRCFVPEDQQIPFEFKVQEPRSEVQLTGQNGNALVILGLVKRALRRDKHSSKYIDDVQEEMLSGDYDHVLQTAMAVCEVS